MAGFRITISSDIAKTIQKLNIGGFKTMTLMRQFADEIKGFFRGIFAAGQRGRLTAKESPWADLADSTKKQKNRKYGMVYPSLIASGQMAQSFYTQGQANHIEQIKDESVEVGSESRIAGYHQHGTRRMAQRRIVFESPWLVKRLSTIADNWWKSVLKKLKLI